MVTLVVGVDVPFVPKLDHIHMIAAFCQIR